jgi:peptidoglycan/LPS O-acetylase OafA/YrhL
MNMIIKEFQGLRGLAVLLVILFHFHVPGFSGGYIGVDIFFVISGYIITMQINKEMELGKFRLSEFYKRRIKRLFPALFIVVLCCFAFAFFVFSPEKLMRFSYSSAYSILSVQNFFLVNELGYFDSDSFQKPLLHIWSLSVEEQFYLFWPILLIFLRPFHKNKTIFLIVVVSFVASVYVSKINSNYSFYMLPFRTYELAIGALAYFLSTNIFIKRNISKLNFLSYPIIFFVLALASSLQEKSSLLLIVFFSFILVFLRGNVLLRNFYLGQVGNISYSLYLIHWPLLVFYLQFNVKNIEEVSLLEKLVLIFISFLLSFFSYYFIEQKFRKIEFSALRWKVLMILIVFFSIFLVYVVLHSGLSKRFEQKSQKSLEYLSLNHKEYTWDNFKKFKEFEKYNIGSLKVEPIDHKGEFTSSKKIRLLVIGDSQAADFVNLLKASNRIGYELRTIPISSGCQAIILPLENYGTLIREHTEIRTQDVRNCYEQHNRIYKSNVIETADVIVVAAHYYSWAMQFIPNTINVLKSFEPKTIYFLGLKSQAYKPEDIIIPSGIKTNKLDAKALEVNKRLELETSLADVNFISVNNIFCNKSNECKVFSSDNYPIFFDKAHFTPKGVGFIANSQEFNDMIDRILDVDSRY